MNEKFISIVVPALNEESTIAEFVSWCFQGLQAAGVKGEIVIVDSSSDRTPVLAAQAGAKVVVVPRRGLGQAYKDARFHIKGDYVIMGDCDLTYDFRDIRPFIEQLDRGYDFVMGTRIRGTIEKGAMPGLHRYFGTPLTTWMLNLLYGTNFSDIHCGMRALTRSAFDRIGIESTSWEYASEMVLKAARLKLRSIEVPIRFYKDQAGRVSHHKRLGWFSPWFAGWINLKVMFLYAPDFFLMVPGYLAMACGGVFLFLGVMTDKLHIGRLNLSVHGMLFGLTLSVLGYSAVQMGILSRVVYDFDQARTAAYKRFFSYDRAVIAAGMLFGLGMTILSCFVRDFVKSGFALQSISKPVILGLLCIILGFQTFTYTLIFNMLLRKNAVEA